MRRALSSSPAARIPSASMAASSSFLPPAWEIVKSSARRCKRRGSTCVIVAIDSDSNDFTRRLNQEAAKTIRYGGATEDEALRMITLNGAWIIGIDDRTGSLDVGKDADITIWNNHPLSSYGRVEKVFIDGVMYFDSSLPGFGLPFWHDEPMTGGRGIGSDDEDGGLR